MSVNVNSSQRERFIVISGVSQESKNVVHHNNKIPHNWVRINKSLLYMSGAPGVQKFGISVYYDVIFYSHYIHMQTHIHQWTAKILGETRRKLR